MSGIGPVEPVNSPERTPGWPDDARDSRDPYDPYGPDGAPDPYDREPRRLEERWHDLPAGIRRTVLAAVAALVGLGVLLTAHLFPSTSSDHGQPHPAPLPASVTSLHYAGLTAPARPGVFTARFRFTVSVERGSAVSVQVVGAASDGLTARIEPRLQVAVPAGSSRDITVDIAVADCAALRRHPDPTSLDVTLRNTRAMQAHSFLFGGTYARDLSALVRGACGPTSAH
ncbi:hypothetical protein ACIQU5_14420 [Streptomyces sp. NPDC090306]|uniref:hypothetical protein n=1 Tax=Streptomyces sp. NPDC090306 TaxID=3365961 RepID=UPI0037F9A7D0